MAFPSQPSFLTWLQLYSHLKGLSVIGPGPSIHIPENMLP